MSTYLLAPGAPDPAQPATELMNGIGGEVIDTAVSLAPVAVPFVLAMTAIAWVLRKFGLKSGAGLDAAVGSGPSQHFVNDPGVPLAAHGKWVRSGDDEWFRVSGRNRTTAHTNQKPTDDNPWGH